MRCPHCQFTAGQLHAVGGETVVAIIPGSFYLTPSTRSTSNTDRGASSSLRQLQTGLPTSIATRGRTLSEPSINLDGATTSSASSTSSTSTAMPGPTSRSQRQHGNRQTDSTGLTAEAALAGLEGLQGGFQVGDHVRALWVRIGRSHPSWALHCVVVVGVRFRVGFSLRCRRQF